MNYKVFIGSSRSQKDEMLLAAKTIKSRGTDRLIRENPPFAPNLGETVPTTPENWTNALNGPYDAVLITAESPKDALVVYVNCKLTTWGSQSEGRTEYFAVTSGVNWIDTCEKEGSHPTIRWITHCEPTNPSQRYRSALQTIESEQSIWFLLQLFRAAIAGDLELPKGVLPDTPAVQVARQMLRVDAEMAIQEIRPLLKNYDLRFVRNGYFHLSLLGALLGHLNRVYERNWNTWIWEDLHWFRDVGWDDLKDHPTRTSLLAALAAIGVIVEDAENEADAVTQKIESEIDACLGRIANQPAERVFVQFLFDSLSQVITATNLLHHFAKLIALLPFAAREESVFWPNVGLFRTLRGYLTRLVHPGKNVEQ